MKILHTADWHIGKALHKYALSSEMSFFFDWLLEHLVTEKIDLLLVSGDIFDVSRPAVEDRKIYYNFLHALRKTQTKIIITGGNHDSILFLEAPRELLSSLDIVVIGGAKENIEDELIVIGDQSNPDLIIAAVPYLRDKDLRTKTETSHKDRTQQIREGIKAHYHALGEICQKKYPNVPAIAMGHLFAKGVSTSESEREIQIGNEAAVESTCFPDQFGYVALGHIHRPQIINKDIFKRYSGSPIALSFSEKEDKKVVLQIEIIGTEFSEPQVIAVPKFRELLKFKGNLERVEQKLNDYKNQLKLPALVELEITEDHQSTAIQVQKDDLLSKYESSPNLSILKSRIIFKKEALDTAQLFVAGENIEDLKPSDVFNKRLEMEDLEDDFKKEIKSAFDEILTKVLESDE